jgi:hypothetical protein
MKFDIAWPRRCFQRRQNEAVWLIEAVLLERKLLGDKPSMQIVCKLAVIDESKTGDISAADKFWADASARLGRMSRLNDRDLDEIEAVLARRVPRPLPQAVELGRVSIRASRYRGFSDRP